MGKIKQIHKLHDWFRENQRDFPWRVERTPYRVLVSEIMLQQTRASVVVPYFEKWMELFPTPQALAEASLEEVIKCWEGLGYYSRARNLHAAAKQIVKEFEGKIPEDPELLAKIRGLGPYTIGAILSFAFRKKAAAIDGNVSRVLSRYFSLEENIQKAGPKKKLEELALESLEEKEPWVTAEAWIELGATLCAKKPECEKCPLQEGCLGYQTGKAEYLPIKSEAPPVTKLFRTVFLLEVEGYLLVKKQEKGQIMADLYEFPYVEKLSFFKTFPLKKLKLVKHSFTRYLAHLHPYHGLWQTRDEVFRFLQSYGINISQGYCWMEVQELKNLPFSSGHRKIMHQWMDP